MILEYRGHEESVSCAIFLPQQIISKRMLLSVSADHTAKLWNVDDGSKFLLLYGFSLTENLLKLFYVFGDLDLRLKKI